MILDALDDLGDALPCNSLAARSPPILPRRQLRMHLDTTMVAAGARPQAPQGGHMQMRMQLDTSVAGPRGRPMHLDVLPSDAVSEAEIVSVPACARVGVRASSAGATSRVASAPARGRGHGPAHAPSARANPRASLRVKKVRGRFSDKTGAEYAKHAAFRRDWGLVLPGGTWARHGGLHGVPLLGLTPREVDLLHILWLVLEKKGVDPRGVHQAWLVCQSVHRERGPYPRHYFRDRLPGTPGFRIRDACSAASAGRSLAPCVLPRGKLWLNAQRRLASAADFLQMQGVNVPASIPWWRRWDAVLLQSIAGNMFTVPVVTCHCAVALLALASGGVMPHMAASACDVHMAACGVASQGLPDFAGLAQQICRQLASSWPRCCDNVVAAQSLSLGTLCSGGDFVVLVCRALADTLSILAGRHVLLVDSFACEADPKVRAFRKRAVAGCLGPCWPDVHHLPLDSMVHCDLLVFGSSCKSLSLMNSNRRSLLDMDASDPAASSGSTLHGCFSYIERHLPKIIIMENVTGLLGAVSQGAPLRNVDIVLSRLDALGYQHGYGVFDSRDFLVPQSRARVYVWAARPEYAAWVAAWKQLVALCRPRVALSLPACVLQSIPAKQSGAKTHSGNRHACYRSIPAKQSDAKTHSGNLGSVVNLCLLPEHSAQENYF